MRHHLAAPMLCLALSSLACPAEEPPPLTPAAVGIVVGEVFEDEAATAGLGGASVEIYGTSARATTVEGKQFVLGSVPLGSRTLIATHPATGLALRTEVSLAAAYQTVNLPRERTTLRRVALRGTASAGSGGAAGIDVYLVGGSSQQLVRTGDDGSYTLTALPAGEVLIGYSKVGYAPTLRSLTLVEGDNAADAVALEPTAAGNLSLSGVARLDGEVDHRGVAILLNGGDQVAVTDAEGRYTFRELSPGLYALRAEADGHRSVELPQVALDAAGQPHGLVDMFLAQGNDPQAASASARGFVVSVISPMTGRSFEPGEEIAFLASIQIDGERIPPSRVTWSRTGIAPATDAVALGSGNPLLVSDLPLGLHQVDVAATAADGTEARDQITVEVAAAIHVLTLDILSPVAGTELRRGEPVALLADARYDGLPVAASSVEWTRDDCSSAATPTALGSGNPLTVSDLPEGLVCLTATTSAPDGARQAAQTTVSVLPMQVSVAVTSHQTNDAVLATVPIAMAADVSLPQGVALLTDDVVWSFRELGTADPWLELGRGANAVAVFPDVDTETLVEVQVQVSVASGLGHAVDSVALRVRPLRPGVVVSPDFATVGVDVPVGTEVRDGSGTLVRIEYTMYQGQPVILRVTQGAELASSIAWSSDTGYLFTGDAASLDVLTAGVHDITLTVTGSEGLSGSVAIRVSVLPFAFAVTVQAPQLTPATPYHVRTGLPLQVQIAHPYQQSFEWNRVRWFHPSAGQIASGWDTRAFNLPAGPGVVWVEVQDAVGNIARAYQEYVLQDIVFTAQFVTPDDGLDVLEGTPVTLRVAYTHSLVPSILAESALTVRYFSSVQGLLATATASQFGVNDAVTIDDLVPGTHVITARISDGVLFAEGLRTVYVRGPGVEASLISPADETMLFTGDPLVFEAVETHDVQVQPLYSWYLDGTEFDASWGGYGADPAASSRTRIALPAYDRAVAPYTDPRWSEGSHDVRFFVRLPSVDAGLGCVNIPGKAACLRLRIHLAPANANICPADNTDVTIGAGQNVVWSGVRRLNCRVFLSGGGSLDILPGSRILVAANGTYDQRKLVVRAGTLTVGRPGASDTVIFQVQGTRAAAGAWRGLELADGTANGDITVTLDRTVLRHTYAAIDAQYAWGYSAHRAELRDVVIEEATYGISDFCPQVMERLAFRGVVNQAIDEGSFYNCPVERILAGHSFEDVGTAVLARPTGRVVLRNLDVDTATYGVKLTATGALDLTVEDSRFANIRGSGSAAAVVLYGCSQLLARGNTFDNNLTGVFVDGCTSPIDVPLVSIVGNAFTGNTTAVRSEVLIHAPDEIHLNIFTGNATNIALAGSGADLDARGNFLGAPGDVGSTGGAALALPPGVIGNLPRLSDYMDNSSVGRVVRFANPLVQRPADLTAVPVAYIREPQRTEAYNTDRCIPLVAASPLAGVDTQADCSWWLDGDPGVGTALALDQDGCLDTTQVEPSDGAHRLVLECALRDAQGAEVRRDRHETTMLIDGSSYSGVQWRPQETWSGTVVLSGDIEVPANHTLVIAPGTTVRIEANDRRRHARHPLWNDTAYANAAFGSRTTVDLFVAGMFQATGSAGARIRLEPTSGASVAGQWGGFRVLRSGSVTLDHADVLGSTIALHGEYRDDDTAFVPTYHLIDALVDGADEVVRGVCPASLRDSTLTNIGYLMRYTHCYQGLLSIDGCTISNVGGTTSAYYLNLYSYRLNGPASSELRLVDTVYDRGVGARRGRAIDIDSYSNIRSVKLLGSTLTNFDVVVNPEASDSLLEVRDSTVRNFNSMIYGGYVQEAIIDRSVLSDGGNLVNGSYSPKALSITRSRIERVAEPIKAVTIGTNLTGAFVFSSNQVEGAATVLGLLVSSASNATYILDVSGNNFLGTTGRVLDLNEQYLAGCGAGTAPYCSTDRNNVIDLDLTGNHFGVATEPEILTLIDEPTMAISGRQVDHGGWSASPLTLDLP